ncbi:MAG: DUF4965 domain-containing protein [Candidatus Sumerlaeota bacterium]|nr:DUF4965 domain-containing protein [Candidatus Sumerlaeota bacterium]
MLYPMVSTEAQKTLMRLSAGMCLLLSAAAQAVDFRPPAVPLIAHDPYFSIWSCSDKLTDSATKHWTGTPQPLNSLARIDGKAYRLMGADPADATPATQAGLQVLPTRTIYRFQTPEVNLTLTFMTPAMPYDLDILSRPVTYIIWEAVSSDGKEHAVSVYFDASAEITVNTSDQQITWTREKIEGLKALRIGSKDQPVLQKTGDNLRIDWGYLYAGGLPEEVSALAIVPGQKARAGFVADGTLPKEDDTRQPREAKDETPVAALTMDMGKVKDKAVERWLMLAYDDLYSIEYFRTKLRPYWRRNGAEAADMLKAAAKDYASLIPQCRAFDEDLMADLTKAGGEKYALICSLAYRHTFAANKIAADANGRPLLYPKENFSNGCINTVDVIYPMDPFFLLFSPTLLKASLQPIMDYSASERWKFPFAPHDLGTYPKANGQVYGGGERTEERQMPVEETGNMLILLGALAKIEGNAKYSEKYWSVLGKWAEFLKEKGLDPENQLCTDDFAGHLAHNVNLSVKAIEGLGAYSLLCEMKGDKAQADAYKKLAKEFADKWMKMADDGDHYRLAFDKPDTWSQKYNLVWDRILGLNLFPASVAQKEMAYYKKIQKKYGLPLDNRKDYTKLDWTLWTATLTQSREDFEAIVAPVFAFLNESPSRVPMTDWYGTVNGQKVGFQARPVIGGVFIQMLYDPALLKKWTSRDKTPAGDWAPMPTAPKVKAVVPTAQKEAISWRYTFTKPADNWFKPEFDASSWKESAAGFGTAQTPGAVVRTEWKTADIWIRRDFQLPANTEGRPGKLALMIHHDEDAEVYINGVLSATAPGFIADYEAVEMNPEAQTAIKSGKNVMAIHCHQTKGGQYIDAGLVEMAR